MYAVQNVGRCVMSCSADNSLCIGFLDGQTSKGHAVPDAGPAAPSGRADRKRADCAASNVAAAREKDSGVGSHNVAAAVAPATHNSGATAALALVGAAQVAQRRLRPGPANNDAQQTAAANDQKAAALRERPASTLIERPASLPPTLLQEANISSVRLPKEAAENHLNELWDDRDPHARVPNADIHAARARSPKQNCSFASKCKTFFSKRFAKRVGSPISN